MDMGHGVQKAVLRNYAPTDPAPLAAGLRLAITNVVFAVHIKCMRIT
jgi:hypothetical protein